MKKLIFILSVALILLSSCATTVSVDYINPSEIDMGSYRNIAVSSTVPYKNFQSPSLFVRAVDITAEKNTFITPSYTKSLATTVASYATDALVETLSSSGYYTVTPPSVTDALINYASLGNDISVDLEKRNIDAIIIPKITAMGVDEYVASEEYWKDDPVKKDQYGNPLKIKAYRYFLTQKVYIDYSYTIIDAKTMNVYTSKSFSDSREDYSIVTEYGIYAPDVRYYFTSMIDGFQKKIYRQLVPQHKSASLSLMSNKPKIKSLEVAYEAAKDGAIQKAKDLFLAEYNSSGHIPSGYNAALLQASMGDTAGAIQTLENLKAKSASSDVNKLLAGLKDIQQRNEEALKQLSGGSSTQTQNQGGKNIFQVIIGE